MAMHAHYWSCSKFADWLRGTDKLSAATSQEWRRWHEEARNRHPIRYWIVEEGLDRLQDFLTWPMRKIYDAKYYINNRWVTGTHTLRAEPDHIVPGTWRDLGDRFLPCMFGSLVDYVEIELAWKNIACDQKAREKYEPPFWAAGWFRWRTWRCPEAGLDHLRWETGLVYGEWDVEEGSELLGKPTHQAERAKEVLALYDWWKNQRPQRPDPHEASGWTEYCAERSGEGFFFDDEEETDEKRARVNAMLEHMNRLEAEHEQEDEDMLIRLIKIRGSLWA